MKTSRRYWTAKGFLPAEASAFKNITTEAVKDSRYIQVMVETRMRRRREAIQKGFNVRQYYAYIRNMYVKKGFATSAKALEFDGVAGRRLAFEFFNAYKSKYAVVDTSGKLIETPRKKVRVKRKPITGKHNIDQMIRKDQDEIKYLRFRLKFERNEFMRSRYQSSIKNYQTRISQLKAQAQTQYD